MIAHDFLHYDQFLGKKIELQEASEPTDIIWENRSITPRQRSIKRCIVYFVILIMLAISAIIIFVCTIAANNKKFRYPKVNCNSIAEEYASNRTLWEIDAGNEFITNSARQEAGKQTFYSG
jgi:hypothetical protein